MKGLKIALVLTVVFLTSGCSIYYRYDLNDPLNRRFMPKGPKWSLAVTEAADPEGRICYDCLYVHYTPPDQYFDGGYIVKRHFPDGQYIADGIENLDVMVERMNDLQGTRIGRFQVEGNQIIYEGIVPVNRGEFFYTWGEIEEDGTITIRRSGYRDASTNLPNWLRWMDPTLESVIDSRYRKVRVEGLKPLELDW